MLSAISGCSAAKLCQTLCDPFDYRCQAPLSSTVSQSLLKFKSIESVMLSNHLILSARETTNIHKIHITCVQHMSVFFLLTLNKGVENKIKQLNKPL